MMKSLVIVSIWMFLAGLVFYLLFSPERGLVHAGPLAWCGAGMVGGSLCLRSRQAGLSQPVGSREPTTD